LDIQNQNEEELASEPALNALPATVHDPFLALRYPNFRLVMVGEFVNALGSQMIAVALGWEIYDRTGSAFALGLIGLVQILPVVLLVFVTGHVADRYNRKRVAMIATAGIALGSLTLASISATQGALWLVYLCVLGISTARAFYGPAASTLVPQTVPPEVFHSATTWSSTSWQLASVIGPALGGGLIAILGAAGPVYALNAVAGAIFIVAALLIHGREIAQSSEPVTMDSLLAGFRFIWNTKPIIASITLDLFAVLFAGATALLPVFAKDILLVGPDGLGLLRAGASIGAVVMAVILANRRPFKQAGKTLLWAVAFFGIATAIFGLSRSFWLSLLMLAVLGALDFISVIIRGTLVLTRTPDELRGRVSAVNNVFVGASNQLGEFESGLVAGLFGPVFAVVAGGLATLLVCFGVMKIWPEILDLKEISKPS
jgi:MFS family permease